MADDMQTDNDSLANEDDEMGHYKKCALSCITFKIVHEERDLTTLSLKSNSFKPEMAYQVFGDSEMIFGYKQLSINLYYLHNSAKCFVDVQSSGKLVETDMCKADDIMGALNPWLPKDYKTTQLEFKEDIKKEQSDQMFGEVLTTFEVDKDRSLKITLCDTKNEAFRDFHERFETLIIWFIEEANFIDLDDPRWTIFYVYEEYIHEHTNVLCRSPVAFCTVYKFFHYPNSVRPRISQFFVLPTHQRKGIATKLYTAVFNYLKDLPEVHDITVEGPTSTFQKIRDFCDSLQIYHDLEKNNISISTQNQKQINEILSKHKICKKQGQRVFDILECLITHKNGYKEYVKFTNSIKKRIEDSYDRQTRGSKRLCNLERVGITVEPIDKKAIVDAEYNSYIDGLEAPVNRLRAFLGK